MTIDLDSGGSLDVEAGLTMAYEARQIVLDGSRGVLSLKSEKKERGHT